jgi:phytanoyl-CoA hydroxylase
MQAAGTPQPRRSGSRISKVFSPRRYGNQRVGAYHFREMLHIQSNESASTKTAKSGSLSPEALASYEDNGYLVVRGLFTSEEIAEIRETFMQQAKDGPVEGLSEIRRSKVDAPDGGYDATDPLSRYPRMMQPHRHADKPVGPVALKYMLHQKLHRVLATLLADEPLAVQSMFYFKPAGARGQDLHQDNFYLRVKPGTCLAAWVSIDASDEENGGMMCVPGTNRLSIQCPEKADPAKYFTTEHVEPPPGKKPELMPLQPGDVLFFNGSVIHGSYPNTSKDRFRRAFICHYVPKGTAEMSHWYSGPRDFDGQEYAIAANEEGGPCGTLQASQQVPH